MKDEKSYLLHELEKEFCIECRHRLMLAIDILNTCDRNQAGEDSYDRLHQEFDSLCGAARAINNLVLEKLFRKTASFIRHLRNKYPDQHSYEEDLVLREAIVIGLQCSSALDKCLLMNAGRIDALISTIDIIM